MFDERATAEEQREWFVLNGPEVPGLLDYLREHGHEARPACSSGPSATTRRGSACPSSPTARSSCRPPSTTSSIRTSTILGPYFASPRGFLFLTPEEQSLVAAQTEGPLPPSAVIGAGLEPAPAAPSRARLDALGLPRHFLLYLGRVDKNKGCDQLFED